MTHLAIQSLNAIQSSNALICMLSCLNAFRGIFQQHRSEPLTHGDDCAIKKFWRQTRSKSMSPTFKDCHQSEVILTNFISGQLHLILTLILVQCRDENYS